jgi:hypothetical protein
LKVWAPAFRALSFFMAIAAIIWQQQARRKPVGPLLAIISLVAIHRLDGMFQPLTL